MNEKSRQLVEDLTKVAKKDKYAVYVAVYVFWLIKKGAVGEVNNSATFREEITKCNASEFYTNSRLFILNKLSRDWEKYWDKFINMLGLITIDVLESILKEPIAYLGVPQLPVSKPHELMKLVASILDIQDTDIVADVQVGYFSQYLLQQGLGEQCLGFGVDDVMMSMIGDRFCNEMIIAGIQDHIAKLCDGKEQRVRGIYIEEVYKTEKKYNKIFCGLCWTDRLYPFDMNKFEDYMLFRRDFNRAGVNLFYMHVKGIVNHLDENGKAVFLMPAELLSNQRETIFRQSLSDLGNVETIISFEPRHSKESQVSLLIVVLTKKTHESIRMIDASEVENYDEIAKIYYGDGNFEKEKFVDREELASQDWVLTPYCYLQKFYGKKGSIRFKGVIKASKRGLAVRREELEEMKSKKPTGYCYVALADIEYGVINDYSNFLKDDLGKADSDIERMKKFIIEDNDIIFTKNKPFKIVVGFEMERKCIASGNMLVIKLDETKVNPFYLKAFFDSDHGQILLNDAADASPTPSLSQEALNRLLLWLPPLEEQQSIGEEYKAKLRVVKDLQKRTSQAMEDLNDWVERFNEVEAATFSVVAEEVY